MKRAALAALAAALALAGGCERELRKLGKQPTPGLRVAAGERQGEIQPGESGPGLEETVSTRSYDGENAWELSQGKRLYRWYNCAGCHSNGGGGMGPALMDDKWLYGHEPAQIYATIMEGRPNGMPSFRGRVTDEHAWQLVAYVRSMSGLAPKAAAPTRSDSLSPGEPESARKKLEPRNEGAAK
jgi:cytochrome c oxidase cbb3-type subunit 3